MLLGLLIVNISMLVEPMPSKFGRGLYVRLEGSTMGMGAFFGFGVRTVMQMFCFVREVEGFIARLLNTLRHGLAAAVLRIPSLAGPWMFFSVSGGRNIPRALSPWRLGGQSMARTRMTALWRMVR